MKFLVREIRKPLRWIFNAPVTDADFPAEPLGDLNTDKNTLSFFEIDNLGRVDDVIAAFASTKESFNKIEYRIVKRNELVRLGYKIKPEKGDTCYDEINSLHVNLVDLTSNSLVGLARLLHSKSPALKARGEVEQLLKDRVSAAKISKESLKPGIRDKLG